MGALTPEVTRLKYRLGAGIDPDLCWKALVNETGSELVDRTIEMFHTALSLGGDASKIGQSSSFFASKIAFLRATRGMAASTFRWLTLPLHIAMVGLLLFIVEIINLFSLSIALSAAELSGATYDSSASYGPEQLIAFGVVDLDLIYILVTTVVLVLTGANAFAPKAAEGGHSLKIVYNLTITMALTGALIILVPALANSIFGSIVDF